ncbi:MAG: S8 family peptidase, partial [Planctomycetota bacterium]
PTEDKLSDFKQAAVENGIEFSEQSVRFPEVVVVLARATLRQWSSVEGLFQYLAEFRRAKIVASEFMDLPPSDQAEFINDLLGRTEFASGEAPAVTILDTGINRGHPLIQPVLAEKDTQAWGDGWESSDKHGHGTELAGVALFGDRLKDLLLSNESVQVQHRLESVKVLPDTGENHPPDYGPITVGSMEKAENVSPERSRVYCLAITADDRDQFLPSLWSAAIDQAVSGKDGTPRRLIAVSAGNLFSQPGLNYPDQNHLSSVQDPAQLWNGLTIGAYTDLVQIAEKDMAGWNPVAPKGRLAPTSTTSVAWRDKSWPIKPELVLEGGNYATDGKGNYSDTADLSILTTRLATTGALLGLTNATSPATAQGARMAAIIQANYPEYWPETVRGMLVHNASWTKEMRDEFPVRTKSGRPTKIPAARLRAYGWGVPNLKRSLACAKHFATMVIQDSIQPYQFGDDGKPQTKEMNFHALPMPRSELMQIADEEVEMRVTLSYFIEPSPGRKGWNVNHRYASHGLRFEVMRPLEDLTQFQQRISRDFWDGSEEEPEKRVRPNTGPKDDRHWAIGEFGQTKGSIHSDFWRGTAGQLAESASIAIFPVTGWWKERPSQGCVNNSARYSLIVTIRTRKTDVKLYSWVANEIGVPVEIETES